METGDSDNAPLAVRRPRRSNFGVKTEGVKTEADAMPPEVKTPRTRRSTSKRRVRFSDPGPSNSGLTPMLHRTSLARTPSSRRRRDSTPCTATTRPSFPDVAPDSGPQRKSGHDLRHVRDGRVERRLRRSALRTALDKLDMKHQRSANQARSQIAHLKSELRARDHEIYELQNATIVIDTDRIWDLEKQVEDLQQELQDAQQQQQQRREKGSLVNWTLAAQDPLGGPNRHMDMDDGEDEDMFGDTTMAQLACSTPSRARSSFPTPPASSPLVQVPETPSLPRSRTHTEMPETPTSVSAHVGVQTSLPDPQTLVRRAELESLQLETRKLTTTLDSHKQSMERLHLRLRDAASGAEGAQVADCSAATVECQVDHLLQTLSDRTAALTDLTSSVSSLGFPGNDASEMLTSLSSAFRTARLELEYLTPGEIALPLTSHGAEVLDLVLERLRDLARRAKEGDEAVDEYHSIETNLRQQLDARVSAMDGLRAAVTRAEGLLGEKDTKIHELEVGNERLKNAVDGYIRDMSELERLVEGMESESAEKDATLAERHDTMADLETRLTDVTKRASDLEDELAVVQASRKKHLAAVNRRSGEALALRDARVVELRGEIDRVNGALREAHERIRKLRVDHGSVEEENKSLRAVVEGMKGELQRVVSMSEELVSADGEPSTTGATDTSAEPGQYLSGKLARRSSGRKRRRYDSGLGFLDEDEVDI